MRGPGTSPSSIARFSAKPALPGEPRSRTVVKPARRVTSALRAPSRAAYSSVSIASRQKALPGAPVRWTCASIRPGRTVRLERSTSRAPCGAGLRPGAMPWIRPSTTVMVEGPSAGRAAIRDHMAGMDDDGLGERRAGDEQREESEQAGEHRQIP